MFNKGVVQLRDVLAQLAKSSGLRRLYLDGDEGRGLPGAVLVPMFEALALTRTLKVLSVAGHHLTEATLLTLASALRTNRGLVALNIDRNHCSLRCLSALADSIRFNDTICQVYMSQDLARIARHSPTESAALATTIRVRTSLNRRRRTGEPDPEDDGASPARDIRFQRAPQFTYQSEKEQSAPGGPVPQFGMDLEDCDILSCPGYDPGVPRILLVLQREIVRQDGLRIEGIFRVAPDAIQQERVKAGLDGATPISSETLTGTPICLANLVKIWFRSLPRRILSPAASLFPADLDTVKACLSKRAVATLLWLLDFCVLVSYETAANKMSPTSLAIVFVPNLIDETSASGDPMDLLRCSQV